MPATDISKLNIEWGICGFASALGALYENNVIAQNIERAVTKQQLNTRLLAEIKTFLGMLRIDNQTHILAEIQAFTQSFGGQYSNFTISSYIQKINNVVLSGSPAGDFSIAMTPKGLIEYLKRIGEKANAREIPVKEKRDNIIIGLGTNDKSELHNGLKHWVYKKDENRVYNWGEIKKLAEVQKDCDGLGIVYQIAF